MLTSPPFIQTSQSPFHIELTPALCSASCLVHFVPFRHIKPWLFYLFVYFIYLLIYVAYGSSQARGQMGAAAPLLAYTTAMAIPVLSCICNYTAACGDTGTLTDWVRWGMEPASSQTLCWVFNLLSHHGNSQLFCFVLFLDGYSAPLYSIKYFTSFSSSNGYVYCFRGFAITNNPFSTFWTLLPPILPFQITIKLVYSIWCRRQNWYPRCQLN